MVTWQIDRFLRSGPLCAVASFVLPVLLAFIVNSVSDVEHVLGILIVGSLVILIGSIAGSIVAGGFGVALIGLGTVLAEISPVLMLTVACGLFASLMLQDLAGSFRRAPSINSDVWRNAAIVVGGVSLAAAAAIGTSHTVATLTTWKAIVVPFGVAAIGFAMKLGADSHSIRARHLTAKR